MPNYKDFRLMRKMNQERLAELLGISQPHLALLESGRREASLKVKLRFHELVGGSKQAKLVPDATAKKILNDLNKQHLKNSILYLQSYLRDCESELHRKQKQIKLYKKKYNKAIVDMIFTGYYTESAKNTGNQGLIDEEVEQRKDSLIVAKASLDYVLDQEPEIIQIRIEGLKEEIRKIKPMIARKKKMLNRDDFDSQEIPGLDISELPVDDKLKIGAVGSGNLETEAPPPLTSTNGEESQPHPEAEDGKPNERMDGDGSIGEDKAV